MTETTAGLPAGPVVTASTPGRDADVDATYARAGFGATVPRGPRPALIVVDLSRGFTEPDFPAGCDLSEVVRSNVTLIDVAHRSHVPVLFTVIAFTAAECDGDAVAWLRKAPGMRSLREGSGAVALDPRLPVAPTDHLIVKKGASAFAGTHVAALLAALHTTTVIVTGATTSGCVRATAVDAVQSGFDVLVPREAVGDRAAGPHAAALFDIHAKYGDVVTALEAHTYLADPAATAVARRP